MGCQTILLDGAIGTKLQELGLPAGQSSASWNIERPELVRDVHRSYLQSGAEILLTNTFVACREEEFAAASSCIAGLPRAYRIAGSLGPAAEHRLARVIAPDVEFFILETYSQLKSAREALYQLEPLGRPVALSFAWLFRNDFQLFSGETFREVVTEIKSWPLYAFGGNCNLGSALSAELARRLVLETDIPLWIKPNAGQPEARESAETFAANLAPLFGTVEFLGGCCGAHEAHIAALRNNRPTSQA